MTTSNTIIDRLFADGEALLLFLTENKELTLYSEAENNFKKSLLLSSASFFEKTICDIILEFSIKQSNNNSLIVSIITIKAIKRQYHTYFDWEKATNANSFFSLFGNDFKKKMDEKVKESVNLSESIKAFLELGQERNKLVHQNYAEVVLDKTAVEIYELYKKSLFFIDIIYTELVPFKEELDAGLATEEKKSP